MKRRKIDINSLPANHETYSKDEEEVLELRGSVRTARKSKLAHKVQSIGNDLFRDIIMPAIKNTAAEFFNNGINQVIFGEDRTQHRQRGGSSRAAYHKRYSPQREERGSPLPLRRPLERNTHVPTDSGQGVYEDLYFEQIDDARDALKYMTALVRKFNRATVNDLYSYLGLRTDYTRHRWGWDDLEGVRIYSTADGYLIAFPDLVYFN